MPKLNDQQATAVDEAESTGGVMEEGIYEMFLVSVKDQENGKPLTGENGPYWKWEFQVPEDAERYKNWHQWMNTSLSEAAAWKLKETFAAFGASTATDTEDLIGMRVRVEVGVRTIQKGARTGEPANQIRKLYPLEEGSQPTTGEGKTTGKARY